MCYKECNLYLTLTVIVVGGGMSYNSMLCHFFFKLSNYIIIHHNHKFQKSTHSH